MSLKTKVISLGVVISVIVIFFATVENYDPTIHNEVLGEFASQSRFQDLMIEDAENEFGTGYSINVYKSDDREELPYNVSSDKYYTYSIYIDINSKFPGFLESSKWEVLEDFASQFEDIKVGEDTKYEGYYDNITLTYRDKDGVYSEIEDGASEWDATTYDYRMNVFGYPKEVNGKDYEQFMISHYEDGQAVYKK